MPNMCREKMIVLLMITLMNFCIMYLQITAQYQFIISSPDLCLLHLFESLKEALKLSWVNT